MNTKKMLKVIALLGICSACSVQQDGWQDLFDGKSLSGWKKVAGDAVFTVEDGQLVGQTVRNTGNTFLITEKEYGDFILELDAKIEGDQNNSGIQTRSHIDPNGNKGKGKVYGRQIEIDPTERSWTGGVYDEARRDWLYPLELNTSAKSAFKKGEFNHFRVECIGNETKTWVNDIPVSYVIDTIDQQGFIGLQVHGIGDHREEGKKVYFKNIKIQTENLQPKKISDQLYVVNLEPNKLSPFEQENGYTLLYDGKSSDGWGGDNLDSFPKQGWEYANGILRVNHQDKPKDGRAGDAITKEQFGAFDLSFEFRLTEGANSGLKYFVTLDEAHKDWPIGLEYQVLDDERHPDAKMGRDGNRTLASLYDLITAQKQARFIRPIGEWNNARIVVTPDNHVDHYLNGVKVLSYVRGSDDFRKIVALSKFKDIPNFGEAKEGHILLQDHGDEVSFRSIKIKKL
ncbi:DUF1080 domain-containing protein [Olivibacter ginsenosidimutans]|uniref:DUF1080 domain-containing protein n=1 Tax=Olivibacter ginsenosidimutans TaxID=1176537 RepID=A0ABP9BLK9_9SPHI